MRTNRRNRCDEILALIDRCLANYEAAATTEPADDRPDGRRPRRRGATPPPFHRSTENRVVAGVAGGIGSYFDVDPVVVRIAFVVSAILGGIGAVAYLAAWALTPSASTGGTAAPTPRTTAPRTIAFAVIAAVLAVADVPIRGGLGARTWTPADRRPAIGSSRWWRQPLLTALDLPAVQRAALRRTDLDSGGRTSVRALEFRQYRAGAVAPHPPTQSRSSASEGPENASQQEDCRAQSCRSSAGR